MITNPPQGRHPNAIETEWSKSSPRKDTIPYGVCRAIKPRNSASLRRDTPRTGKKTKKKGQT
jgi:hypothetical protein